MPDRIESGELVCVDGELLRRAYSIVTWCAYMFPDIKGEWLKEFVSTNYTKMADMIVDQLGEVLINGKRISV
jgi:hypothetical protein